MHGSELGQGAPISSGSCRPKTNVSFSLRGTRFVNPGHLAAATEARQFDLRGTTRDTQALGRARHAVRGSYAPDASLRADMHI